MLLHPAIPGCAVARTKATIARGIHRTPFGDKHGKARIHGRNGICPLTTGRVATRIVVECISNVVLGIANRIVDCVVGMLVPVRITYEHQVVRILTNRFDDRFRVSLDSSPRLGSRFIENFENHVVIAAPLLSHVAEEGLCVVDIVASLMAMIVDNHVDIVVNSRLNHGVHQTLVLVHVAKVVPATPILIHTHGCADNLDILLFYQAIHNAGCPERGTHVAGNAPEKAHALHGHFGTTLNALAGTVNLSLTAGLAGH